MKTSAEQCAAELLETAPLLMRVIRANVRSHRGPEMSVPQFRALAFVGRREGASLSDVAAHLGLTPPSASKLIDGLVSAKLATRKMDAADRRRVSLALTAAGRKRCEAARAAARGFLAAKLERLTRDDLARILDAMNSLKEIFDDSPAKNGTVFQTAAPFPPKRLLRKKEKHG